jgi:hypothetical protein
MPFQNPTPPLSPNDYYLGPNGGTLGYCAAETIPRNATGNITTVSTGNGTLYLAACYLAAGTLVSRLGWLSQNAAVAPLHQWLGLYDLNRNQLAMTADQGSAAIANTTQYSYPIATIAAGAATSFTTNYTGLYYLGILLNATTTNATCAGQASTAAFAAMPPILSGSSDTVQTTVPAFPHQATTITPAASLPYLYAA